MFVVVRSPSAASGFERSLEVHVLLVCAVSSIEVVHLQLMDESTNGVGAPVHYQLIVGGECSCRSSPCLHQFKVVTKWLTES